MNMTIGFIGAGNVGTSLGRYFITQGEAVAGYASRTFEHAQESAMLTNTDAFASTEELVAACDWLFLTVSDSAIATVFQEIEPLLRPGMIIFHCSGAASAQIMATNDTRSYAVVSLHPISAFPAKTTALDTSVIFTLEGDSQACEDVQQKITCWGNEAPIIDAPQKALYHAACVTCSNLVNGLVHTSQQLFSEAGFSGDIAQQAFRQLFLQNAQNIYDKGPVAALTGPIERGDQMTVDKHLAVIPKKYQNTYRVMSKSVLEVAKLKHPSRNYEALSRSLEMNEKPN